MSAVILFTQVVSIIYWSKYIIRLYVTQIGWPDCMISVPANYAGGGGGMKTDPTCNPGPLVFNVDMSYDFICPPIFQAERRI